MSAHTPGPWSVEYRTLKNARGESIASAGNNRKVWGDELDASLRLAAAAPELLAEHEVGILDLNLLRNAVEANDPKAELLIRIDDILRRKKAAIAIAKGEKA